MEYQTLALNLKNLAPNGVTLNIEEKMQVQLALTQLQGEMNFEELYFWGKVEGKYWWAAKADRRFLENSRINYY